MNSNFDTIFLLVNAIIISLVEAELALTDMVTDAKINSEYRILSRRKRFITFPEGSSFQLVFCTQNLGYLQLGDIIWFGNTAALAWELPTDPIIFQSLKDHEKVYGAQRRQDTKHVIYLDENGKVVSTRPYRRRPIVNPAFAKRSIDSVNTRTSIPRGRMHDTHKLTDYFDKLDEHSIKFHRLGRKSFYAKLENLLKGLGWRGKECIQRLLCENKNTALKQGTFLEEILRLTFTLPRDGSPESKDEYDPKAHGSENCESLYPCELRRST